MRDKKTGNYEPKWSHSAPCWTCPLLVAEWLWDGGRGSCIELYRCEQWHNSHISKSKVCIQFWSLWALQLDELDHVDQCFQELNANANVTKAHPFCWSACIQLSVRAPAGVQQISNTEEVYKVTSTLMSHSVRPLCWIRWLGDWQVVLQSPGGAARGNCKQTKQPWVGYITISPPSTHEWSLRKLHELKLQNKFWRCGKHVHLASRGRQGGMAHVYSHFLRVFKEIFLSICSPLLFILRKRQWSQRTMMVSWQSIDLCTSMWGSMSRSLWTSKVHYYFFHDHTSELNDTTIQVQTSNFY